MAMKACCKLVLMSEPRELEQELCVGQSFMYVGEGEGLRGRKCWDYLLVMHTHYLTIPCIMPSTVLILPSHCKFVWIEVLSFMYTHIELWQNHPLLYIVWLSLGALLLYRDFILSNPLPSIPYGFTLYLNATLYLSVTLYLNCTLLPYDWNPLYLIITLYLMIVTFTMILPGDPSLLHTLINLKLMPMSINAESQSFQRNSKGGKVSFTAVII